MSGLTVKAPRLPARFAQAAVAAAAVAEVARAVTVRAHALHPLDTPERTLGRVSQVYVNLMIVAAALFLVWFTRSRRIARSLSSSPLPGSDPWAVFSWLIPVINMWVPRGLVLDVLRASGPGGAGRRDRVLVNVWWATWVGHALVAALSGGPGPGSPLALLLVAEGLELAAAALAIAMIQRITAGQAAALASTFPAPGAASLPRLS
ncbi:DUF4328 domain-containing protein [Streptomyces sp. IBSBF 3136]|uniref:DUF4328 domain-containing protein n=1 Tax=Streptomyces sp. IBSBF 3136 TaxID=2903524 RepID=UPI002FDBCCB3